jgi:hypothetical protein
MVAPEKILVRDLDIYVSGAANFLSQAERPASIAKRNYRRKSQFTAIFLPGGALCDEPKADIRIESAWQGWELESRCL